MIKTRLDVKEAHYLLSSPDLSGWLKLVRQRISVYRPPLQEPRFWVIVILVAAISATHSILETVVHLSPFGILYFVPSALFLIPVVYAAVTFGLGGAPTTSLIATAITIPNWVFFHESWETLGCMSQLFVVKCHRLFHWTAG